MTHVLCGGALLLATVSLIATTAKPVLAPAPAVPVLQVPPCNRGVAVATNFTVLGTATPAGQQTRVELCATTSSLRLVAWLDDAVVMSPHTHCDDDVWAGGDVFETFVAPVDHVHDAPIWYYELDTGAAGAVYASHVNNSRGNASNCADSCREGRHLPPLCNAVFCDWELPCAGAADFRPAGYPTLRSIASNVTGGWRVNMSLPFALFSHHVTQSRLWRANFYRYDYEAPGAPAVLSGWSADFGGGSFHAPHWFGVLKLLS